jgi:ubiquinone/menaquinone biosynthesis C-methylase UbiE
MTLYVPHPVVWTIEKVERFWNFYAANKTGDFFSDAHSSDLANRIIAAARPRTFVDIGCGTGPLVRALARRGVQSVGIDSSAGVLREAERVARGEHLETRFMRGSAVSLPLADQEIDCAALIEVVEHLDDDTLSKVLREALRVLRVGGILVVTTPNHEDLRLSTVQCPDCGAEFHNMQHVRTWTRASLRSALAAAGFHVKAVSGVRILPNGSRGERVVRRLYYRLRRQTPRLIAIASRTS